MTFFVYVGLSLCVGYFGRNRAIGFWGFFVPSIVAALFFKVFGPLAVLAILLLTREKRPIAAV